MPIIEVQLSLEKKCNENKSKAIIDIVPGYTINYLSIFSFRIKVR